jgi:hypothetical protein
MLIQKKESSSCCYKKGIKGSSSSANRKESWDHADVDTERNHPGVVTKKESKAQVGQLQGKNHGIKQLLKQ